MARQESLDDEAYDKLMNDMLDLLEEMDHLLSYRGDFDAITQKRLENLLGPGIKGKWRLTFKNRRVQDYLFKTLNERLGRDQSFGPLCFSIMRI